MSEAFWFVMGFAAGGTLMAIVIGWNLSAIGNLLVDISRRIGDGDAS